MPPFRCPRRCNILLTATSVPISAETPHVEAPDGSLTSESRSACRLRILQPLEWSCASPQPSLSVGWAQDLRRTRDFPLASSYPHVCDCTLNTFLPSPWGGLSELR